MRSREAFVRVHKTAMSFRLSQPRPVTPPFIASRAIAASTAATRSLSVALSFCSLRQHSFLVSGSFNEPFAATIRATVVFARRDFSS